jgi:hypothetical protein
MFDRFLRKALSVFESKPSAWAVFGLCLALVLHTIIFVLPVTAQDSSEITFSGRTPRAAVQALLDDQRPPEVEAEIGTLSQTGDYGIADYWYGEGGGMTLLRRAPGGWETFCGTGGAWQANDLVNFCGLSLGDAQTLWQQYVADGGGQ